MIEEKITEQSILTKEEMAEIVHCHSIESIDIALSNILLDSNLDHYLCATRFFRDVINYGVKNDSGGLIHQNYQTLSFFKIIENNLNSEDRAKRNDAVYTLGKVCAFSSIPKIQAAIAKFHGVDSDYSDNLKSELEWLISNQKGA